MFQRLDPTQGAKIEHTVAESAHPGQDNFVGPAQVVGMVGDKSLIAK
jgi:hypothetical protein